MTEGVLAAVVAVVVLAAAAAAFWRWHKRKDRLQRLLDDIAFEREDGLIIPGGDAGEIQIDHIVLTARGVLVLHIKEVVGTVFGGNKMAQWTVIAPNRRFTFSNPQPALLDRVAAVRQIIKDVPVEGRVLFLDGAEFTKGIPDRVVTIDELRDEFGDLDSAAATRKVEAFKPYWEQLRAAAVTL